MDRSRVMLVLVLLLLPIGGLEARLVQLQLLSAGDAAREMSNRRESVEIVRPARGPIWDSQGRVLAQDEPCFDCYLVLEEYEKSPGSLAAALRMPPVEFQQAVEAIYEKIEKQVQA